MATYGVDTDANLVSSLLLASTPITIETIDLTSNLYNIPSDQNSASYQEIPKLTNADFTVGDIEGAGTFDVMMQGVKAQLKEEFDKGRITGADYTKAYVSLVQSTQQNAVQYLLGRDQAYWQAVQAQVAAVTARVQNEIAKYQATLARLQAETEKQNLALTKAKLGTEDAQYGEIAYRVSTLLPAQLLQTQAQTQQIQSATDQVKAQTQVTTKQLALIAEQVETARAQTLDVRSDGQLVAGSVKSQKDLYAQQVLSYRRDSELKAAKIYADAWTVMKTSDDGLLPPNSFTNAVLDEVLNVIKTNNGL